MVENLDRYQEGDFPGIAIDNGRVEVEYINFYSLVRAEHSITQIAHSGIIHSLGIFVFLGDLRENISRVPRLYRLHQIGDGEFDLLFVREAWPGQPPGKKA